MTLPITWVANIKDRDKQKVQLVAYQTVLEGDQTFKRLRQIIKEDLDKLETTYDYNNPSWAYQQAHNNGIKEGLTRILKLIGDHP